MFSFAFEDGEILQCHISGFFDVEEVRRYSVEMRRNIAEAQRRWGRLRLLVDSSQGVVQSAEAVSEFEKLGPLATLSDDRMAVVVASSLMVVQTRRVLKSEREKVFLLVDEARAWLTEGS